MARRDLTRPISRPDIGAVAPTDAPVGITAGEAAVVTAEELAPTVDELPAGEPRPQADRAGLPELPPALLALIVALTITAFAAGLALGLIVH